jgi:hypothetical protein
LKCAIFLPTHLAQQNPMLAQKAKQGQQRQTQYRRLIALNPVK